MTFSNIYLTGLQLNQQFHFKLVCFKDGTFLNEELRSFLTAISIFFVKEIACSLFEILRLI